MFRDALHSSPEDATLKLSTMRLLDAWAGRPICRALTLVRRVLPGRRVDPEPSRILLVKFWGMGSLVCATPLATALLSPVSLGSLFASRRGPSLTLVTSSTSRAAGA